MLHLEVVWFSFTNSVRSMIRWLFILKIDLKLNTPAFVDIWNKVWYQRWFQYPEPNSQWQWSSCISLFYFNEQYS